MQLSKFISMLQATINHRPDEDPKVVIGLANPAVGSSAVTAVRDGFDWDDGKLFIKTDCALIRHSPIVKDDVKEHIKKLMSYEFFTKQLSKQRKHCYEDGFLDGVKWGSYRLLDYNENQKSTDIQSPTASMLMQPVLGLPEQQCGIIGENGYCRRPSERTQ